MTWKDIEAERGEMVALIVSGSVEQHGPHLPTGTDLYIAMGIADRIASLPEAGDIAARLVLLPPFFHAYAKESDGWRGTLNLDGNTLTLVARDIIKGLFRQGIKRAVLLNGHLESYSFLLEGIELATEGCGDVQVISVNWWDFIGDGLISELFADRWPGWVAEHAALTETSIMLALHPELVREDLAEAGFIPQPLPYKIFPQPQEVRPPSGMYAPAEGASAEIGERLISEVLRNLVPIIRERFR